MTNPQDPRTPDASGGRRVTHPLQQRSKSSRKQFVPDVQSDSDSLSSKQKTGSITTLPRFQSLSRAASVCMCTADDVAGELRRRVTFERQSFCRSPKALENRGVSVLVLRRKLIESICNYQPIFIVAPSTSA